MDPTQPAPPPPPPPGGPQPQGWPAPGPYTSPGMPYAVGPHGPPGGPGPYGRPARATNGLAVASLVSGLVCCLPPLGLVLGLVALPQIRKKDQAGRPLAITGIVFSALGCLLLVLGLVTGGFASAWNGFKEGVEEASRSDSPFSLRTGQCFTDRGRTEDYTTEVTVVDCARPHDAEVTGGFKVTGFDGWPGEDAIDAIAEKRCEAVNQAYAMDTWLVPEDVWPIYYLPSRQSWRLGDRIVTCAFATDKEPFSGSVRSDATTLSADQEHFLKTVNPIETALHQAPEEDPDEDLAANRAWAAKVLVEIDTARADLGRHSWPGASAAPVATLRKDLAAASKRWRELMTAADSDAYWEAYDTAFDALPDGADARTALGLTGTPPEDTGTGTSV
ncbi:MULTISPECIES: DUF4190 domain-containing protein [unclassified Streptomyces]|uniref:DUF4190 domain-containing protein n=1 Tax=unclassified Streptomyces TaxID=2593676 RepID=UPI0007C73908|nr:MULTISPECIES: DUF4190 domain-containing protein [unclassified Streptomyces]